jgi:hypothetical protein
VTSVLRKKSTPEAFDPVSAATWAAGALATARVNELIALIALSYEYKNRSANLRAQIDAATALTPCSTQRDARTKPCQRWSFQDYLLAFQVCEALRKIVVDGVEFVPNGKFELFDTARVAAANAVIAFVDEVEVYTKLIRRERAMERLSGTESLRRGLRR